jgi:hypothetical protein
MSLARVKLAAAVTPGEVIAMESADDAEGFLWWLARAEGPAECYRGSKKTVDGVTFVDGGYYISLRYYERFPPNSPDIFKLSAHIYKENAEGVISRSVTVTEVAVRRSVRANPSSLSVPPMTVKIEEVEKTRLDEIPRLDAV